MATDVVTESEKSAKPPAELLAYIKKELDADAERHANLQASGAGELPHESQTGMTLDLGHKNLRSLPLEVVALIKDRVERLALSHNPQISIPVQIAQCDRLRYLNIRWNQLVHFPQALLQLTQLEILDVSKNRINAIPEEIKNMTSLKYLAVARNRIERLPYAIGEMASLGKIKFEDNPIIFPPPDALKLSLDSSASAFEAEREKDICQKVKRYLRAAAMEEKLRAGSSEELNETNAETPRPHKKSFTGGRFPIRPSLSGLDSVSDIKADVTPAIPTPPIPQRSHARGESSNAPVPKRPGIAPLLTGGNEMARSQSETVTSFVSLRTRRQGFVPSRKPTGGLGSVTEVDTNDSSHSRAASSISITNGGDVGSGSFDIAGLSDAVNPGSKNKRTLVSLPAYRNLKKQGNRVIKSTKRLFLTLRHLEVPVSDVGSTIRDSATTLSKVERKLNAGQAQVTELARLLNLLEAGAGAEKGVKKKFTHTIIRVVLFALDAYGAMVFELKRKREDVITRADSIYLRALLFEFYGTIIEARNICTVIGLPIKDLRPQGLASRQASQTWSSKTVTPTQPRPPTAQRIAKPPTMQKVNTTSMQEMSPPPMTPMSANRSRTNTMTSQASTLVTGSRMTSRTNTMRSVMDEGSDTGDEQFAIIVQKLQATCNVASQALPMCRTALGVRIKETAQNGGNRSFAHPLSQALGKSDEVGAFYGALKARLDSIRVNDTTTRHQREFWQLCDALVQAWTEFATEVRQLNSQGLDISNMKEPLRGIQRTVKEASKAIMNSSLYHQAMGPRGTDASLSADLASPLPSPLKTQYASHNGSSGQSGYATPVTATLSPAAQTTLATPTTLSAPRDYFPEPTTARAVRDRERDRHDTPMQPAYGRRFEGNSR